MFASPVSIIYAPRPQSTRAGNVEAKDVCVTCKYHICSLGHSPLSIIYAPRPQSTRAGNVEAKAAFSLAVLVMICSLTAVSSKCSCILTSLNIWHKINPRYTLHYISIL